MFKFTTISIIYNPKSTGPGKTMAIDLYKNLQDLELKLPVTITPTKYAGHAEKITYDLSVKHKTPLIISVSGDGGYNEVVNGAAKAYEAGLQPITSLLPAGNANDHHNSIADGDIVQAIKNQSIKSIDLLQLTSTSPENTISRYAHSYIGFGMTPDIGKQLTATKLNVLTEMMTVANGVFTTKTTKLVLDDKSDSYDSITISNIDRMAKVLTLGKNSLPDDGKFEINIVKHRSVFSKINFIFRASTVGVADSQQSDSFELKTTSKTLVQLDGEVVELPANATVKITIGKHSLLCI